MKFWHFEIEEIWETLAMVSLYGLEGVGSKVQSLGYRSEFRVQSLGCKV